MAVGMTSVIPSMLGVSEPERRVATRKSIQGRVVLVFAGTHRVEVRAEDISATGMGVIVERDLKLQFKCQIHLQLPGKDNRFKSYEVSGKTVNSTLSISRGGFRIGLMFHEPPPEFRQAVEVYIKR